MSLILLDTTFLVDAERVRSESVDAIDDEDDVAIAAITIAELLVGLELATKSQRAARARFVDDVLAAIPVIPYGAAVATHHAQLLSAVRRVGRPRGAGDLLVAATAKATGRMVVTADRAAFANLPGVTVRPHP